MNFTLKRIKALAEEAMKEKSSGDDFLESVYDGVIGVHGHTTPYYTLFRLISKAYKPKLVVELGAWRALAAAQFAVGNPNTTVVTIDSHEHDQIAHRVAVSVAEHYDNLYFIHGRMQDAFQQVRSFGPLIDILFIDAHHEYSTVMRDWQLYASLLHPSSALVIVDDVFDDDVTMVGMVRFWDEIRKGHESMLDVKLHRGIPMGFMKYKAV